MVKFKAFILAKIILKLTLDKIVVRHLRELNVILKVNKLIR